MSGWTISVVLIAPAALLEQVNALATAMGWGPDCYSVPLSLTGAAPATHWGLRTWATASFVALVDGAARGELPQELAGTFAPADVATLIAALIISTDPAVTDPAGHFAQALDAHGLQVIEKDV